MRRFTADQHIPEDARGASIALGNFDGVHLGHAAVIEAARASAPDAPLAAAVFDPHPRRFFQPEAAPFLLQTREQRARALAALGVDILYEIGFDAALARTSDADFSANVLAARLGARHVSVGADFRYGRGRSGDGAQLTAQGRLHGFGVTLAPPHGAGGAARVSSSAIRAAITAGDMAVARALLGRPWAMEGEVVRGFQRGRGLGYPTVNLEAGAYVRPRAGVYAARVRLARNVYNGVSHFGVNPTVGGLSAPVLETYIFDFDQDIYGQIIEVELIAFLRAEETFAEIAAMTAQIARDSDAARAVLANLQD